MALTRAGRTLDGPDGPVRVSRAEGGVLRVVADSAHGRAFGLGWGHAEDRILQLDLLRVAGRGQVAERVAPSPASIAQDLFMRSRGFWPSAVQQAHALTPAAHAIAAAYAAGINRWLDQHARPLELRLLGLPEQHWQPADSVLVMLLQSYLGLAQSQEVAERFIAHVGKGGTAADVSTIKALFAPHLDALDVALMQGVVIDPLHLTIDPLCAACFRSMMASNAYAIPPSRSASGSAIVAGEPHLDTTQLPPFFYECILQGPDTVQAGVTIPGVPGVIAGRWTEVAAAVTYGFVDQIDFFVEEVQDGCVRRESTDVPLEPIREEVRRKGSAVTDAITLWRADGRLLHGDPSRPDRQRVLAMQWALDGRGMDDVFALPFALETAEDVDAARAIVARYPQSLQFTLGDTGGRTGLQQGGLAPQRAPGHSGLDPQPGWDRRRAWRESPTPPHRLHGLTQGPEATEILVTANETTNPTDGPIVVNLGLSRDRRARIEELLTPAQVGLPQLLTVHRDRTSRSALAMLEVIRPHLPANRAGHLLRQWDGVYDPRLEAPALFERFRATWLLEVYGAVFDRARSVCPMPTEEVIGEAERPEDLPVLWSESNSVTTNIPAFDQALLDPGCPALQGRDWLTVLEAAMERSLRSPARRWGAANRAPQTWFVFASAPPALRPYLSCQVPVPGTMDTPEQGRIHRIAGHIATVAPVWRMVADLGEDSLRTALSGGPSDRFLSLDRWLERRRFARYALKTLDW